MTAIIDEPLNSDLGVGMRPEGLADEFDIDPTPIWPADDDRLEPIFLGGPLWFDLEELAGPDPLLDPEIADLGPAEPEAVPELDPERAGAEPDERPPAPRRHAPATGLFGSLGVHLLPLLVLIGWSSAPAELPPAIPVQFVVAEAPPEPAEAPPDRLVTETLSETRSDADNSTADAAPPPPVKPPPTKPPPKTASVKPPPKPSPPPEPTPRKSAAATPPTPVRPAPSPAAPGPPIPDAQAPAPRPAAAPANAAPQTARLPGPDPARSDYFDRLVALTRTHLDLLPRAFLAGRRGQTVLSIVVLDDGTIGRISVKRSSGYPDIDTRIEQIVAAVGRFPPLPASFEHPSVELDFDLTFPNALQQ